MSNTVSGTRLDDAWRHFSEEPDRTPSPASAPATRTLPMEVPIAPPDTGPRDLGLPGTSRVGATLSTAPPTAARDAQVRSGLDAFRMSVTGWYRTPGGDVAVSVPFLMSPGYEDQQTSMNRPEVKAELTQAAARSGLAQDALDRIHAGRGTPDEIHRLTQALIDAQPADRPSTSWTPAAVRRLMYEHMIGLDCAGYAQQAYLCATGRTAKDAGLGPSTLENLSGLSGKGFDRVDRVAQLRPGDLVVLGPKPRVVGDTGHRAIVYDQRPASVNDLRTLLSTSAGQAFAVGGPVRVVEIDSSFGSSGSATRGGVERQTWLYNEATHGWAQERLDGPSVGIEPWDTLYAHPLEGFYRKKGD